MLITNSVEVRKRINQSLRGMSDQALANLAQFLGVDVSKWIKVKAEPVLPGEELVIIGQDLTLEESERLLKQSMQE